MKLNNIILFLRKQDNPVSSEAADILEALTPRPIEEAPKSEFILIPSAKARRCVSVASWNEDLQLWRREEGNLIKIDKARQPAHFIPLSAIQALMEGGNEP